jgi:hypothetical protein
MQTSLHVERDNQETTRAKLREILNPKPGSTRREREKRCESEANATHRINPTSIAKSLQKLYIHFFLNTILLGKNNNTRSNQG